MIEKAFISSNKSMIKDNIKNIECGSVPYCTIELERCISI